MMLRSRLHHEMPELPDDVLISVQAVSREAPLPEPEPPKWMRRILPKSGLAGQYGPVKDSGIGEDDEEEEEEEEDAEFGDVRFALKEISFDVRAGQGVAIAGSDTSATQGLYRIIAGSLPPSGGRVLIRGRVAALSKKDLVKYFTNQTGVEALFLVARFLHWPRSLLRARKAEIMEFAKLDELSHLEPRQYRNKSTMRLLYSAALHMDAAVYLVDEGIPSDDEFGARCFDLLEQRQREGAAIVQRALTRVETAARFCNEVLWLEGGELKIRGRPLEVAIEAEKAYKEELHPLSVPIMASLAHSSELVEVNGEGGAVEIDLEILRKHLGLALTLQLTDQQGKTIALDQPGSFRSEAAGLYRLRISIPGGLLPDATYRASLLAEIAAIGAEPMPPRELLAFEVVASSNGAGEDEGDVTFAQPSDWEAPGTESQVEWHVSRAAA